MAEFGRHASPSRRGSALRWLTEGRLALALGFFFLVSPAGSHADPSIGVPQVGALAIIANPEGPLVPTLSAASLRAIFSLEIPAWPNGRPIRVLTLTLGCETQTVFVERYLHVFSYQLQRSWDRNSYSGFASQPVVVASDAEMVKTVRATPGSIGFVNSSFLARPENRRGIVELKVNP